MHKLQQKKFISYVTIPNVTITEINGHLLSKEKFKIFKYRSRQKNGISSKMLLESGFNKKWEKKLSVKFPHFNWFTLMKAKSNFFFFYETTNNNGH